MKKLCQFTILAAFLGFLTAGSLWAGITRYVNLDGICDGNSPCYTTIQAAIDDASPGDVIMVEGTYEENVNVYKSVTIDGQELSTLICGIEYWTGKRGDGFRITASDVTIKGFTIIGHYGGTPQDFNNPGVMIGGNYPGDMANLGVERVTISNNVFTDSWSAIYNWKSSNNLIIDNTIYNMDWRAIQIYDGSWDAQIQEGYDSQNNKIIDNEVYNSWGGLYVGAWGPTTMLRTDNSGTIIQGNYFHNLTDFAVGFGFTDSADIDISSNTMENNVFGICVYGWWVPGGLAVLIDTTVASNIIDSNDYYGIIIVTGDKWTIQGNDITKSNAVGIYIFESKGIEAHRNNIVENTNGVINSIGSGDPDKCELDAELNYWGSPTGPSRQLPNGKWVGRGDSVSSDVDYKPWLPHQVEFWKKRF